jgi:hypothetical protein
MTGTGTPLSPRLIRGGIVLVDPATGSPLRVIVLQYNPDSISRSFQIKGVGETTDRSQALRLRGPAVETIKLEAELDAIDQLEFPDDNEEVARSGLGPVLATLEGIVNPTVVQLRELDDLAGRGTLEIAPMEAPLPLFVWSRNRVLPVRVTDMSITEEAFDTRLNPIRAKVSLGLRVLSVDDLGFRHRGGAIFMATLGAREALARKSAGGTLAALGIEGIPS